MKTDIKNKHEQFFTTDIFKIIKARIPNTLYNAQYERCRKTKQ